MPATREPIITDAPRIDALIAPFESRFPRASDFRGYRAHCLRMLNYFAMQVADFAGHRELIEIALAFHDATIFDGQGLDYLDSAAAQAQAHLARIERTAWQEPVTLMIVNHHKLTAYRGPHERLVEAMRRADWIDVSLGMLRFGLDRMRLAEVREALPLETFYPRTMVPFVLRHAALHPRRPLPNFRW